MLLLLMAALAAFASAVEIQPALFWESAADVPRDAEHGAHCQRSKRVAATTSQHETNVCRIHSA